MASEWTQATLGTIAAKKGYGLVDGSFGSNLPASLYTDQGIPVIRGSNLALGTSRFRSDEFVFVSEETARSLERSLCRPDDIVFTKKGTIGQTGLVPRGGPYDLYLLSSNQMKLTVDPAVADPLYVYYFVSAPSSIEKIIRDSEATGVPKTNVAYLRDFPIALPALPEQRAIAHILGTLDDKIELNRRVNETLEAMARALFKSWFVDFDPVRAKAEGRDPGLPKPLADLFPDRFENSELGDIPAGWRTQSFAGTVDIIGGGTPRTSLAEYWGGDIPWFSVVDAPTESDVWVVKTEKKTTRQGIENSSTQILAVGTTIITARGTVGRIALVGVPMAMNQSCYGLHGKAGAKGFFTYFATQGLVASLQQHAHGSVFDTITRDTLIGVSVVVPPTDTVDAFEERVGPSLERARAGLLESDTLAAVRDALLPQLLSGGIRPTRDDLVADTRVL
jgi:restriction endonuclease S subunit